MDVAHRIKADPVDRTMVVGVPIRPGLTAVLELDVTEADTAIALRSGAVPVVGTPRLLALFEEATMSALTAELNDGQSTVGMRVQLEHISPTAVGGTIRAEATLDKIEGRRLTFTVSASDQRGLVAAGKITRVLIDIDRFMSGIE
jgi:fluoroacetyl-CoA thioesterase